METEQITPQNILLENLEWLSKNKINVILGNLIGFSTNDEKWLDKWIADEYGKPS
ncbi:hypothetical protein EMA8858_04165 [Emticicia aquatica]|uniref:Uncharacterized protein n=1 Tax=Emticicia aquatica TaxID=1681835 RepID=A0ABN8F3R6_9BACT|nr:hypothetical protein [Emticicia aquatica]CAH0998030.1 hypothetical protein EMA8858_04165 [Emticicia aquatica]